MAKKWYVVQSQAVAEDKAHANLTFQGFETFFPRFRKRRRHARKVDIVLAPLYPRYLFVRLDLDGEPWRRVNGTFGVVGLVGFGERPCALPEPIVDAIRERCDGAGVIDLDEPEFKPGQALHITGGPLANLIGLFEKTVGTREVVLLVQLLGRAMRVSVPFAAVRTA